MIDITVIDITVIDIIFAVTALLVVYAVILLARYIFL